MDEFFGLIHSWMWNKYFKYYNCFNSCLKQYKTCVMPRNYIPKKRNEYWSGYMSRMRGLHWDRRRH